MDLGINYRLLYVTSPKYDKKLEQLKSMLQDDNIKNELETKNIQVAASVNDDNGFNMILHEMSGMPITSSDMVSESSLRELLDSVQPLDKNKQTGGKSDSYKIKYQKYKNEYMEMKDVIVSCNSFNYKCNY
jgi:hypothetical protein